jgi:hypothetical protein
MISQNSESQYHNINEMCNENNCHCHFECQEQLEYQTQIYRYKLTQDFMDSIYQFSKIHQYDDRKSFKEAWEIWVDENDDIVTSEVRRLNNMNYTGDIYKKMFKSARYYFRNKGTEKNAPVERRKYIGSQKELIEAIDAHIKSNICKPSDGFNNFCNSHIELLEKEINYMVKNGMTVSSVIREKIKKTYKNRYFLFINNQK